MAPSWLDLRLVLGVALVIGSMLVGAVVVASATRTARLLAVSRDLAAGTVLRAEDVHAVSAKVPDDGRYLRPGDPVVGRQLTRAVSQGELLPAAAVRPAPPATTVTVPFAAGQAPVLSPGQRIEVWLSAPGCPSVVLLPDATVQGVRQSSALSGDDTQQVTLSLPREQADRVVAALAIQDAQLRAGILSGPGPSAADVPELTACSAPRTS